MAASHGSRPDASDRPGKVISGIGWNFVGMIAGTVAGFLSSIILARLLAPHDYGNLALTLSVLNVLVILSALGFEFALNKYIPVLLAQKKGGAILNLVWRLAIYKVILASLLSIMIFVVADMLAQNIFRKPELGAYIRVLSFLVIPFSLEPIFRGLLTAFYLQKFINLLDAGVKFLYLTLSTAALLLHYGVAGVLYASILCQIVLVAMAARKGLAVIPEGKAGKDPVQMGKVLRYSLYLYLFTIMNFVLGQQLDLMMIGALLPDIKQVAFYTIAYSFSYISLSMFSLVLGGGITLTYFSELYAKKDLEGLRRSYTVMVEYVFVYIIPVGIVGAVLAPQMLFVIFGEEYAGSTVVSLLALYFPVMIVLKFGGVTSTFMGAMDQERKLVTSRSIFGGTNIVLNFLLIPPLGAFGALIGTGAASILGLAYESVVVHRSLGPRYPLRFLARMVGLSLVSGGAAFAVSIVMERLAVMLGYERLGQSLLVLAGAGGCWLIITFALFVLLKPLSPETVDVIEKVPIPFKKFVMGLIRRPGRS
jgi:O-antigen/teichoic acid export membrane protein